MKIIPYEKNAKRHPENQVLLIAKSISRFGWQQPIKVGKEGVILAGHGRFQAYETHKNSIPMKEPWVIDEDGKTISGEAETRKLTLEEENAYRLADNQINALSDNDMKIVVEELKLLTPELLSLTGYDADLILENDDKDDIVPSEPKEAKSKLGDIYVLGRHRIICGDSTKVEDIKKLMNGHLADMVFTDPPYNVDYKGKGDNTKEGIMNDKMSDQEFSTFLFDAFKRMAESIKRTAGCYVFHSHKTASDFEKALGDAGFHIDTQLIWNKPSAGMGMNDYRTKHEPFFYTYLSKEDKVFYGDRTGTTVWKVPQDEQRAFKWFQKQQENLERGGSTVWSMSRENVNSYLHPTQKPVELPVMAITKSSKPDDIVFDPFLGSGVTLIAAEKTGRICYGLELDPKYVDVIVQRYVDYVPDAVVGKNGIIEIWQKTQDQLEDQPK